MAKDTVYSALLKPTGDHGRNVFPLDNKQVYSMKAGQITPVKCLHFMPNDYFDIQAHDFSLTFPMNTAAFLRGRKEFAFYSVYYNAVWSLFNQYQAGRLEPKTSAFPVEPTMQEPRIKIIDLLLGCLDQWSKLMYYKYKVEPNGGVSQRTWKNSTASVWKVSSTVDLMSNSYWVGFASSVKQIFQRVAYSWPWIADPNNIKMKDWAFDVVGQFRAYNWLRKLDMLGYGNYYPFFRSAESKIAVLDTSDVNYPLMFANIVIDLGLDLVDTCTQYTGTFQNNFSIVAEKKYNLYPICAYNAIFYHFFRNSFYDFKYYSHNYNLDFVSVTPPAGSGGHGQYNECTLGDFDIRFLDIEYHQWKKDRFTGVLPDQQFGAVSGISLNFVGSTGFDSGRWTNDVGGNLPSSSNVRTPNSAPFSLVAEDSGGTGSYIKHSHAYSITQGFDVIALKRAEMLQDYRQQLMRAGNKTTDIFRALYGKECSSEHVDDVIPRFLETFGEDIFVDPVTATADTGADSSRPNGNLGDLSARGKLSGSSGRIKFNAGGNFGVILCLAYVVPTAEYNSYMVDKHLMELTPESHFIPQFENLGLEDIYNFELNCLLPYNEAYVLGKVPRYYHKKGDVDQVHGAFCSLPYEYIGGQSQSYQILSLEYGGFTGDFNHWVSPRSELQGRLSTTVRDFYINPSVLDNVFVRAAGYDLADDQFICNTYFEIRSTKEMSKVGFVNFV